MGTSTSSKSYGGDSECRPGDRRIAGGLETTLRILEPKLMITRLVYTQGQSIGDGEREKN